MSDNTQIVFASTVAPICGLHSKIISILSGIEKDDSRPTAHAWKVIRGVGEKTIILDHSTIRKLKKVLYKIPPAQFSSMTMKNEKSTLFVKRQKTELTQYTAFYDVITSYKSPVEGHLNPDFDGIVSEDINEFAKVYFNEETYNTWFSVHQTFDDSSVELTSEQLMIHEELDTELNNFYDKYWAEIVRKEDEEKDKQKAALDEKINKYRNLFYNDKSEWIYKLFGSRIVKLIKATGHSNDFLLSLLNVCLISNVANILPESLQEIIGEIKLRVQELCEVTFTCTIDSRLEIVYQLTNSCWDVLHATNPMHFNSAIMELRALLVPIIGIKLPGTRQLNGHILMLSDDGLSTTYVPY